MASAAPQLKPRKLIVVMAFGRRKGGELKIVRVPQLFDSEEQAVRKAEELAPDHVASSPGRGKQIPTLASTVH